MSLTEMLQKVLDNIDRLQVQNEELVKEVTQQIQEITQLKDEKASLEAEVQRLWPFELEVCASWEPSVCQRA
jgi:predicted RNase H-like nuclease (RuvC/YqgF family)